MNRWLLFSIFITIFLTSVSLALIYLRKQYLNHLLETTVSKIIVNILTIFIIISPLVTQITIYFYNPFTIALSWLAYILLGIVLLLFAYSILKEPIWLLYIWINKIQVKRAKTQEEKDDHLSRKDFFKRFFRSAVVGTTGIYSVVGLYNGRYNIQVKEVDVKIPDLPNEFNNFTIMQLSDIHIGLTIGEDYITELVKVAKQIPTDMVAITGDIVDGKVKDLYPLVKLLTKISSVYGTYCITGNHEYYSGVFEWVNALRRMGMKVLLNENDLIKKGDSTLMIAGVTDYRAEHIESSHKTDVKQARTFPHKEADVKILLAHQPRSIYKASKENFDLQLSGHTHAGQLFPATLLVYLVQPYVKGLNKYKNTQIYVNQGTGYWGPPMRLGTVAEITKITLKRESL